MVAESVAAAVLSVVCMHLFPAVRVCDEPWMFACRYLRRNPRIQEHMARCVILRLLLTVRRLHAAGILHLDLKLENVAVDENFGVRILDFGLARFVKGASSRRLIIFFAVC